MLIRSGCAIIEVDGNPLLAMALTDLRKRLVGTSKMVHRTTRIGVAHKIAELADSLGLSDANAAATPIAAGSETAIAEPGTLGAYPKYRGMIGSLLWIARTARPDIAFAVNLLSRFCGAPGKAAWEAGKHVVRYLLGTRDVGITFECTDAGMHHADTLDYEVYSDADHGGCPTSARSTTGILHVMGKAAFDHTTRRQTCVAKSTAVAESYALADADEQVRGHVEFIKELGLNIHKPLPGTTTTPRLSSIPPISSAGAQSTRPSVSP